jgi:hypothetical protein
VTALADYLNKVRPIVDREASGITALPRPAARQATLERFVTAVTAADQAYRQAAAAATRGDSAAVASALARLHANPAATLARRYGLTACAGTGATVS